MQWPEHLRRRPFNLRETVQCAGAEAWIGLPRDDLLCAHLFVGDWHLGWHPAPVYVADGYIEACCG